MHGYLFALLFLLLLKALMKDDQKGIEVIKTYRGRKVYSVQGRVLDVPDRYQFTSILGRGAYGTVCCASDEVTGRRVAVKCVNGLFDELIDGRRIWREMVILRILRQCKCRNIIKLLDLLPPKETIESFRDVCIVTDLFGLDLHALNRSHKALPIDFIRIVIAQVLRCVSDMHQLGVIHRDVKPSNILLKKDDDPMSTVLCDFGLARAGLQHIQLPTRMTDYVVTRWYRAPELLVGCPYDYAVDVWSVGCVMAECFLKTPLFPGKDYIHQLQLITASIPITNVEFIAFAPAAAYMREAARKYQGTLPLSQVLSAVPPDAFSAISSMLSFSPVKRVTADEALHKSFFDDVEGVKDSPCIGATSNVDFGFDLHAEVSEAQLRRLIWDEMALYRDSDRNV